MPNCFFILPDVQASDRPERFTFPFSYAPHPWAQRAAEEVMHEVRTYMAARTESELHRSGKMFGVLVAEAADGRIGYLRAFSAMLDGTYHHEGFVPPVFDLSTPNGYFKQEEARISAINKLIADSGGDACSDLKTERKQRSQALQRWMFSQYRMLNCRGEEKDLMQLFASEKPILSEEEYYRKKVISSVATALDAATPLDAVDATSVKLVIPPSGAGECCAPKLLQTAFSEALTPLCMAEFWMGASPKNELRIEGQYYPACQSRCKPILRHMLDGIPTDDDPVFRSSRALAQTAAILYEDEYLLAVVKPAGLLTAPGADGAYSLQDWVQEYIAEQTAENAILHTSENATHRSSEIATALPAHRLDMDTSGIILFGKTREAYIALQMLFQSDRVEKRYEALIRPLGAPVPDEGTIRLPLNRDPLDRPRQRVDYQHGKASRTDYSIVEHRSDGTLLIHLYPRTGRTHQLRVHCAHPEGLHAPILGDRLYGDSRTASRLMLHAAEIRFPHPFTGEDIRLIHSSQI